MAGKRYRVWVVDLRPDYKAYTWPKFYRTRLDATSCWGEKNVRRATLTLDEPTKPKRKRRKKP